MDNNVPENPSSLNELSQKHHGELIQILEARLAQANDTIARLSSFISSYYTVLGICLGVFGLFIPVLNYFYYVVPTKESIENINATMDKKIEIYLADYNRKEIESAINNLKSSNRDQAINAVYYLQLSRKSPLTSEQISKIIRIVDNDSITKDLKLSINSMLSNISSIELEQYFIKIALDKNNNDPNNQLFAFIYLTKFGNPKNIEIIIQGIENSEDKMNVLTNILTNAKYGNKQFIINFLNSPRLYNVILKEKNPDFVNETLNYLTQIMKPEYTETELRKTYLYRNYKPITSTPFPYINKSPAK
jgi:hypothetical protein